MKKRKASGPDGIQNEAWLYGKEEVEELRMILNEILKGGEFPTECRKGNMVPVYKKGGKTQAASYRGITLIDTGYKIYTEILRVKLENDLPE